MSSYQYSLATVLSLTREYPYLGKTDLILSQGPASPTSQTSVAWGLCSCDVNLRVGVKKGWGTRVLINCGFVIITRKYNYTLQVLLSLPVPLRKLETQITSENVLKACVCFICFRVTSFSNDLFSRSNFLIHVIMCNCFFLISFTPEK